MAKADLTAQRLRELLHYDPKSGSFTWVQRTSHRIKIGSPAGSVNSWGRIQVGVLGHIYYAHRLAWFYSHGEWPRQVIDHIDGNPLNNQLANLRDVSPTTNAQNVHIAGANSKSGLLGALWHSQNKNWRARIMVAGKSYSLGCFKTPEAAHEAYKQAKRRMHEGCTI